MKIEGSELGYRPRAFIVGAKRAAYGRMLGDMGVESMLGSAEDLMAKKHRGSGKRLPDLALLHDPEPKAVGELHENLPYLPLLSVVFNRDNVAGVLQAGSNFCLDGLNPREFEIMVRKALEIPGVSEFPSEPKLRKSDSAVEMGRIIDVEGALYRREAEILGLMAIYPNLNTASILSHMEGDLTENAIHVYISKIRKKLGADIITRSEDGSYKVRKPE